MTIELISIVANIVLTLLLLFQWDRKYASEQATKLHILAARRMIGRLDSPVASDITDNLDATLATLDARSPFLEWGKNILSEIHKRFKRESESQLLDVKRTDTILNK